MWDFEDHYNSIYFNTHKFHDMMLMNSGSWLGKDDCHPWHDRCNKLIDMITPLQNADGYIIINGDTDAIKNVDMPSYIIKDLVVFFYEPLTLMQGEYLYFGQGDITSIPELEYLSEFNERNDNMYKITAYCCDYNIDKIFGQYKNIKLKTYDIFCLDTVTSWIEPMIDILERDTPLNSIANNFICPNFRYTAFREALVGYLSYKNYNKNNLLSFFYEHDPDIFETQFPNLKKSSYYDMIKEGIAKMQTNLPYHIDAVNPAICSHSEVLPYTNSTTNQVKNFLLVTRYKQSLFSLITESRYFTPMPCISEKTLKPLIYKRPFVIIGGPYSLQYLHELGFKTFGDFIDESYDNEENHVKRFETILKNVDYIANLNVRERIELFKETKEICEYNYRHIVNNQNFQLFSLEK